MNYLLCKMPFLIELLLNGIYLLLYSLQSMKLLPPMWRDEMVFDLLGVLVLLVPIVLLAVIIVNYFQSYSFEEFFRRYHVSFLIFVAILISSKNQELVFWLATFHLLYSFYLHFVSIGFGKRDNVKMTLIERLKLKPTQIVLLSFATLIFLGAFLLKLPVAVVQEKSISLVDAFFIATSATCVTGLSPISIVDNFTIFGQFVILLLVQVGGLGIMTLQSVLTILVGRSMGMKNRLVMQDLLDVSNLGDIVGLIFDIVKYTLIIELWGAIVLTLGFTMEGLEFGRALYYGLFHSVSAFCNAGFALFNNSLESFSTNYLIHGTISVLIILGGLGFVVLKELKIAFAQKRRFVHFTLHTKIVLVSTISLILLGTIVVFFGEFLGGIDGYSLWGKLQVSFFQSVTLRTAGFNTIPLGNLNIYTVYLMTIFMFIGASPGSTAGGIKVTTLAILIQSVRSTLRGMSKVELFGRSIPNVIVVRATAVTIISLSVVALFVFFMIHLSPEQNFLPIFFEVMSAFGTVGLTLGLTPYLTVGGKLAIILLMFIGRVGPLTMVLAIGQESDDCGKVDYPDGRIMIG